MYYLKDTKRKPKSAKEKSKSKPRTPSLSSLVKKLDLVFSQYIRLRDSRPFGYKAFRCISCGQIKPYDQMDCGHFIGRTHMATRFDEDNCHGECRLCNRFSADHMIYYYKNLVQLIGQNKVDLLTARGRGEKKWSPWELQWLINHYQELVNKMLAEQ